MTVDVFLLPLIIYFLIISLALKGGDNRSFSHPDIHRGWDDSQHTGLLDPVNPDETFTALLLSQAETDEQRSDNKQERWDDPTEGTMSGNMCQEHKRST